MSTTPRPPLLSDEAIHGPELIIPLGTKMVRDMYEAARAKDAELIQMAVNACTDPHKMSLSRAFLSAAAAAGFTPSEP